MKARTLFFGLVLGLSAIACSKDSMTNTEYANAASCTGVTPTYTTDIKAIMDSRCATSGCHSASSAAHGIKLHDLTNTKAAFDSHSNFLATVHHASGEEAMPQGSSKLSDADIQKLDCWFKNGMP
jgi:hypothetical protein